MFIDFVFFNFRILVSEIDYFNCWYFINILIIVVGKYKFNI